MVENKKEKSLKVPEKKKHNRSQGQQTDRSAKSTSPQNASLMTQDDNSKVKVFQSLQAYLIQRQNPLR